MAIVMIGHGVVIPTTDLRMSHPFPNQDRGIVSPTAEIAIKHGCDQGRMQRLQIRVAIERPTGADTIRT
jgi:hypothetical protein